MWSRVSFFVILRNGSLHSFLACYIVFIVLCVFRFKKWELKNWENGPVCFLVQIEAILFGHLKDIIIFIRLISWWLHTCFGPRLRSCYYKMFFILFFIYRQEEGRQEDSRTGGQEGQEKSLSLLIWFSYRDFGFSPVRRVRRVQDS